MKRITVVLAGAALFVSMLAAPAVASETPTQVPAPVSAPAEATAATEWVPWDGLHITSAINCAARIAVLREKYGLPGNALTCTKVTIPACPTSYSYWLVMVNKAYYAPPMFTELSEPQQVAACA